MFDLEETMEIQPVAMKLELVSPRLPAAVSFPPVGFVTWQDCFRAASDVASHECHLELMRHLPESPACCSAAVGGTPPAHLR